MGLIWLYYRWNCSIYADGSLKIHSRFIFKVLSFNDILRHDQSIEEKRRMPVTLHSSKAGMGLILISISLAGCASSPSSYPSYPDPYRPVYSPSYPPVYVDPYPTTYTRSYPNYVYERRVIVRDQYRNNHHYQPLANHPRSNRPACPNPVVKDGRVVNCRH
jgi:hypothetical protein